MLCEMQTALSRIWTRVAVSISSDDDNPTTSVFLRTKTVHKVLSFTLILDLSHTFLKAISLKVNVKALQEFELGYFGAAI